MKKLLLPFLLILTFIGCSDKEEDYSNKKEQELWINGYTTNSSHSNSDVSLDRIRFLFFKGEVVDAFQGKSFSTGVDSYYEYTQLSEDPIYTKLVDEGKLLLKDGTTLTPILDKITSKSVDKNEIILPVGKYFVVAYYYDRGYRRDYWNKYSTTIYNLESSYNAGFLTVVIPVDYTKYGNIGWRNWHD